MKDAHRSILRSILSQPTASFHEDAVAAEVARWADRNGVECSRDKNGNVVIHYRHKPRKKTPRWVFVAHMDHPGFVVESQRGLTVRSQFLGSIGSDYFPGARVRLFLPDREVCATVLKDQGSWDRGSHGCRLKLDEPAKVPPHTIGMWDLPAMRVRGTRLSTRACDDLVGVSAILCAFEDIIASGKPADVTGLLTRGEEVWLVGTLAACLDRTLPEGAMVVSIETSKAQPRARLGDGVVVRVGDAVRTFDPAITAFLSTVAGELGKEDKTFRAVRQLMPGGICEASVYNLTGHPTGALCLPLGNYHNGGRNNKIQPEQVDLRDFASLVKLVTAVATWPETPAERDAQSRKTLRKYLNTHRDWLRHGLGRDATFRPIREPLRKPHK